MAQGVNPAGLLAQVRACTLCAPHLPLGPRPLLAALTGLRLTLVLGQYAQDVLPALQTRVAAALA